jgi:choline dehydrogenase-like flavoprotein
MIRIRRHEDSNIIVVGAGPAGAATAAHLARAGLKMILIDRQKFPRERHRTQRFLDTPRHERSAADGEWVFSTMQKYRSIDFARPCARQLAGGALREFVVAYGDQADSEHKRFVEELVIYMIERES